MIKILTIVGARPQFIKAAMVSREIQKINKLKEVIIHTGQHFDLNMSEIFFEEMQIPVPDYKLNINSLSHGAMTGRMIEGIEKIIQEELPNAVMIYGDTNSTIAGALAAKKLNVDVIHVEAGLRSNNMKMPEEINRILTDRISDILFCPTDLAMMNLKKEGFDNFNCKIIKNGDVMFDAALFYSKQSEIKSGIIERLKLENENFVLATFHRQENTDVSGNLKEIIDALNSIHSKTKVVVPMHPRTKKQIIKSRLKPLFDIIEPVGYYDMIELLKHCKMVMTDSGGLQKEAFFFKKYCVTMREQTEWVELVKNGYNILSGSNKNQIITAFEDFSSKKSDFNMNFYGDGHASEIIVKEILEKY